MVFLLTIFPKLKKEILSMQTLDIMLAMQDDAFAEIISNDPILQELEKELGVERGAPIKDSKKSSFFDKFKN